MANPDTQVMLSNAYNNAIHRASDPGECAKWLTCVHLFLDVLSFFVPSANRICFHGLAYSGCFFRLVKKLTENARWGFMSRMRSL